MICFSTIVNASEGWRRLLGRWLPLLLWMATIFIISHRPSNELPAFGAWDLLVKKSGHFLAYAVLAALAYRVTAATKRPILWAMAITALYAASDEFHQLFVDGRQGSVLDVLIDCAGGATALYLIRRGTFKKYAIRHSVTGDTSTALSADRRPEK